MQNLLMATFYTKHPDSLLWPTFQNLKSISELNPIQTLLTLKPAFVLCFRITTLSRESFFGLIDSIDT